MKSSLPVPSTHGIFQARTLEWGFLFQEVFPTQGLNPHLSHLLHRQAGSLLPAPHSGPEAQVVMLKNPDTANSGCRVLL